jgi:large subunit ribosomal protein L10
VVKGGLLGDKVLAAADVTALADVPPRDVLLARLAGGFQAPLAKAASLFGALPRKTAYAFQALIDQRTSESPAQSADGSSGSAGEAADEGAPGETLEAPQAPAEAPATEEPAAASDADGATDAAEVPAEESAPESTDAAEPAAE